MEASERFNKPYDSLKSKDLHTYRQCTLTTSLLADYLLTLLQHPPKIRPTMLTGSKAEAMIKGYVSVSTKYCERFESLREVQALNGRDASE